MDTNCQTETAQADATRADILRLAIALGHSNQPTWVESDPELVAVRSAAQDRDEAWTAVWGG